MGFLRRILGGTTPDEQPASGPFPLPESGYLEVAGVIHSMQNLGPVFGRREEPLIEDMPATVRRDPANRYDANAVEVRIRGALVGYLPRDAAAAWNPRLRELEADGKVPEATAHVWYRWARSDEGPRAYVHLRLSGAP